MHRIGFACNAPDGETPNTGDQEANETIPQKIDSFVQLLPEFIKANFEESSLPSLSIAIVYDRDIVCSETFGFADLESKKPVTTASIYPIASLTKLFIATMLVQLAEAGVVTLDTPVNKYLPE